jgi:hypothetical protein
MGFNSGLKGLILNHDARNHEFKIPQDSWQVIRQLSSNSTHHRITPDPVARTPLCRKRNHDHFSEGKTVVASNFPLTSL